MTYKAYISHAHEDNRFAMWLQQALENYEIPDNTIDALKNLYPIYAHKNPKYIHQLTSTEHQALRQTEHLIVLCSSHSALSYKINEEIKTYRRYHKNTPIIILIIEKTTFHLRDSFPDELLKEQYKKKTTLVQVHDILQQKNTIILKVIAGISRVKEDTLRHKDKLKTLKDVSIDMSVIAILLLSLGFFFKQWNTQTNNTVTDINKTVLTNPNNIEPKPHTLPKPILLAQTETNTSEEATNLHHLANIHNKQNHNTQAKKEYNEVLHIYQTISKETPEKYNAQIATTYNNLAYVYSKEHNQSQALLYYQKALDVYHNAEDLHNEADIAMIYSNILSLYGDMNDKQKMKEAYQRASTLYKKLSLRDPKKYDIPLARVYIMGIYYHIDNTISVKEIQKRLKKHPQNIKAKELLEIFN